MKINIKDFRVEPSKKAKLKNYPTRIEPFCPSKKDYKKLLDQHLGQLNKLQQLLYASNTYSLLIIFQGMDASGKDGSIRHVMSGIDPQGCQVHSFIQPSLEELKHDFLWRTTCKLPERGKIGIFNRSYYEEVLVTKVHPHLIQSQKLPKELMDKNTIWKGRYHSIADFESHLHRNGIRTIKIFLHLSPKDQRDRLCKRLEQPDKKWKFNVNDLYEAKYWKQYMSAYEDCLNATSTQHSPWYVIPADDKENARLIISQIVINTLESLKITYPKLSAQEKRGLDSMNKQLRK
jgi:PPK2 family polyphosphate:nucleotide phosphotransferase